MRDGQDFRLSPRSEGVKRNENDFCSYHRKAKAPWLSLPRACALGSCIKALGRLGVGVGTWPRIYRGAHHTCLLLCGSSSIVYDASGLDPTSAP